MGAGEKLKRFTGFKIWQDGNYPILLDTNKLIEEKLAYIHNNPVVEVIVDEPRDYVYSSARNYQDEVGIIALQMLN